MQRQTALPVKKRCRAGGQVEAQTLRTQPTLTSAPFVAALVSKWATKVFLLRDVTYK